MTKREQAARARLAEAQSACERCGGGKDSGNFPTMYAVWSKKRDRALAHLLRVVRQEARAKVTA